MDCFFFKVHVSSLNAKGSAFCTHDMEPREVPFVFLGEDGLEFILLVF